MPRATATIPFHALRFEDDLPTLHEVERRLKTVLRSLRRQRQGVQTGDDEDSRDKMDQFFDYLNEAERRKIRRRAHRYVQRLDALSGLSHLSEENRAKLTPLRGGLPVTRIATEHETDEIAAALHAEMPWMALATEAVWHGLRASAREGLPGVRFTPLVLIGPPGIGKSFWARRLAHHLEVPATRIDATGEPASFALTGSQRGWGSAHAGKLVNTVLNHRHGGPLVIIDEIEKADEVHSNKGTRHTLTDALLPLLERMSGAAATSAQMYWIGSIFGVGAVAGAIILPVIGAVLGLVAVFVISRAVFGRPRKPEKMQEFAVRALFASLRLAYPIAARLADDAHAPSRDELRVYARGGLAAPQATPSPSGSLRL